MPPTLPPLTLTTVAAYARRQLRTVGDLALFTTVCALLGASSYLRATTSAMTGEVMDRLGDTLATTEADAGALSTLHRYMGLVALQAVLYVANVYLHQTACDKRTADEHVVSYRHFLSLDQGYRDAHTQADVENTMRVASVHRFVCWNLPYLLCLTFEAVLLFVYMAQLHLPFTLGVYATFAVVQRCVLQPFFRTQQRVQAEQRARQVEADAMAKEAYTMFATIKLFGTEAQHVREYARAQAAIRALVEPIVRLRCVRELVEQGVSAALLYVLVAGGVHRHLYAQLSVREWTSFFVLLQQHQTVFTAFQWHWGVLVNGYPNIYWYRQRLATRGRSADGAATRVSLAAVSSGELLLDDVRFAYPTAPDTPVLRGVSCACLPGTLTAFVGPSGAGKSTLLKLVAGMYTPTGGVVTVDGVSVAALSPAERARVLAVVPQQPLLFRRSLRANLLYGRCNASTPAATANATPCPLEAVLARVHCADLVSKLDDVVSSESLSAGQSQRLAMARAILRDARIVVLDEVTSALDTVSERRVQATIQGLVRADGRTVVVVAHRLATVREAARIVWMADGAVVEAGTHAALVAAGGAYARGVAAHVSTE